MVNNKKMFNKIKKNLSKEDLERISSEIKNAEEKTSAEIVVSIKRKIPFIYKNNINKFLSYAFNFYKIYETKNRTGILIIFILKDKKFYIIGDEGINKKVQQKKWDEISNFVSSEIKNCGLLSGIINSIKLTSEIVAQNFPLEEFDKNEIPDKVRF